MMLDLFVPGPVSRWRALSKDDWRQRGYSAVAFSGLEAPRPCVVQVVPVVRDRRGVMPCGSVWPSIDGVLDGLVAAGVLAGRGESAIRRIILELSETNDVEGFRLSISS